MATHRVNILAGATVIPDSSGEVFPQPYVIVDTGAVVSPIVMVFNDTSTKDGLRGAFRVPENYVGSANLSIVFTANATSGNVIFDWSVLPRSGVEDMGAAAARTSETVTKAGPTTAFLRTEADMSLTDADYAAGDEVLFELFRDGTASDTMAAAVLMFGAYFEYADA